MQKYKIIKIDKKNKLYLKSFLELPLKIYGDNYETRNMIQKTEGLIKTKGNYELYLVFDFSNEKEVVGRMSIGSHNEIKDSENNIYGHIGLFEVIEDYDVFSTMIDFARSSLSDHKHILFPFFISTWYNYRFTIDKPDSFDFFLEPPGKNYYNDFIQKYHNSNKYFYKSYISNNLSGIIDKNEKLYKNVIDEGYSFRTFNKKKIFDELKIIYDITIPSFNINPFYCNITFDEFYHLNKDSIKFVDEEFMIIAEKQGIPIGFSFAVPDYTPVMNNVNIKSIFGKIKFLFNKNKTNGFIIKTVGVLPEYRKSGILGSMAYMQTLLAKKRGYDYVIGALVYEKNPSASILVDTSEKSYVLYEIINKGDSKNE